jgi:hypothetical protein
MSNVFHRLPAFFPKAFVPSTILSGWKLSGLYPFNRLRFLISCPTLYDLSQENLDRLTKAMELFDSYIIQVLSQFDLIELESPIDNISRLVLKRQRAAWLNSSYCIALRR